MQGLYQLIISETLDQPSCQRSELIHKKEEVVKFPAFRTLRLKSNERLLYKKG
jgi:hypothetical protein